MNEQFRGTGVALVTPFHKYGTIDFQSLERLIEFHINEGVEYLLALGTTSEYPCLSKDERIALVDFIVQRVNRRVPLLAGVGGSYTREVIQAIEATNFTGIDAILSVTPYYNKPQPKGQYLHFREVAGASPVPVILYNVPGRTGTNMSAETIVRLASDFDNIIGVKEASGDLIQVMDIINHRPQGFLVISGEDALTLPIIMAGGDGVISVIANAYPGEFSQMVRMALKGNVKQAREIHYKLYGMTKAIFADGNPGGIKALLEMKNRCRNTLRLPLAKVNKAVNLQIKKEAETIQGGRQEE